MLLLGLMWTIPYNLIMPYFSLFMAGLGCSPDQIGLVSTAGMAFQAVFSLFAAPVTDRLGRKRTTLIFDMIGWSGSMLILALSQNYYWFLAAAAVQSLFKIVDVSGTCLMVEDTDKRLLVRLFSWRTIAGLLAGFFSPLSALIVYRCHVVSAMRWMILSACLMMTAMFLIRNHFCRETSVGRMRMEQSRHKRFFGQIAALIRVTGDIRRRKNTLLFFALSAVYYAALAVKAPFFALLLTGALKFSVESAGIIAAVSSFVMLAGCLFAQPLLRHALPKAPLSAGLCVCALGSLALVPSFSSWWGNLAAVVLSAVLTAVGTSVAQPCIDGLSHASIDNEKRSDMTSMLNIFIMGTSAPFGWIGGMLYTLSGRAPFLVSAVMFAASAALVLAFYKNENEEAPAGP